MARKPQLFTVYHMMEQRGDFDKNPNNPDARDADGESLYRGPTPYPKMLYHPDGVERVITPAEIIETPMGPKMVGEKREIVYRIVGSAAEERELTTLGWHDHPQKAKLVASGQPLPEDPKAELERLRLELAELQAQQANASAKVLASQAPVGAVKEIRRA